MRPAPLRVRYSRVVAVGSLVLGLVCLLLGAWVALLGAFTPAVVVGLVPLLTGGLMLARPYFLVEPGTVRVRAMVGTVEREFPFHALVVEHGRLTAVSATGERTRVPVSHWIAHAADWVLITAAPPVDPQGRARRRGCRRGCRETGAHDAG